MDFEINTGIGTSGKYHAQVWKWLGDANGWECLERTHSFNTRQEAQEDAEKWLEEYKKKCNEKAAVSSIVYGLYSGL